MNNTLNLQVKVSGDGNPIVLVPGGLTGWKSWDPFTERFSSQKRKVIQVQLLSVEYGIENRQLPDKYTVHTESQALESTLNSLEYPAPLDIVAWSYGGLVSLDYSLNNPERIRTLTLIEPPAIWVIQNNGEMDAQTKKTLGFFNSLHDNITDSMLAAFLQEVGLAKPGHSPSDLPQWHEWLPFKQALRNGPAVVSHTDELKRLKTFKSPVLLVKGTGSAPFLHKIIYRLCANLPDSRVIELAGGHAPHIASREKFLSELEHFQKNHRETSK